MGLGIDPHDRFWSKVDIRGPDECWPWKAAKKPTACPGLKVRGKTVRASRIAWERTHGPIPAGMHVLHHCDNPPCCNPVGNLHLFLGTHQDNMRDRDAKGRRTPLKGEAHGRARLTETQVRAIRRRIARGERMTDIGRRFGVGKTLIHAIKIRRIWRHVQ